MKTYLHFSVEGKLKELKIKEKIFNYKNYANYSFKESINYNKYNFIILYNKNLQDTNNITSLPFYNKTINGNFLLFSIDNENNLKSLTENKLLKLLNNVTQKIINTDYSSDDFLSD